MNTEPVNKCGLKREDFQTTVQGKKTDLFVLRNNQGNEVAVTNYGGAVVALLIKQLPRRRHDPYKYYR